MKGLVTMPWKVAWALAPSALAASMPVTRIIGRPGRTSWIRWASSMPSIPGMDRSMNTRS